MINFGKESENVEFKKSTLEMHGALVDISAILNKSGEGTLYFGVNNSGDAVGMEVSLETLRDVSSSISAHIRPEIFPTIKKFDVDGKKIIEVKFSGRNKPYSAYGKYYIRISDESRELVPEALREMMLNSYKNSDYEEEETEYGLSDVDDEGLNLFYRKAIENKCLPDEGLEKSDLLKKLGLLKNGHLNRAGNLLFGKEAHIVLKEAVFATDEKLTFIDMLRQEGNIFTLINSSESYIKKNIHWSVKFGGLERDEIPEIPLDALREIIVNSFLHSDYNSSTEHEVDIHPSRIVIYNPGSFPREYTPLDFVRSNIPSSFRNKIISKVLYYSGVVESFGSGFKRVDESCKRSGVGWDYVKYDNGFSFIFNRKEFNVKKETNSKKEELSKSENDLILAIKKNKKISINGMKDTIKKSLSTTRRILSSLVNKKLVSHFGPDKGGYWEVL